MISAIGHDDADETVETANDSMYVVQVYVFSSQPQRALRVARDCAPARSLINRITPEPITPFGGVKQSGIGREFGVFGMEAFLERRPLPWPEGHNSLTYQWRSFPFTAVEALISNYRKIDSRPPSVQPHDCVGSLVRGPRRRQRSDGRSKPEESDGVVV